ncbi:hypothetical protein [Alterisphingorhabdus coralli]|uniref:ATPase n=1 Tax=Alterisphingorhabdus coralli TaxID=3071408 RepID=A0AA97HZ88_9SPHN|nr:hypothetical protein [Parasphingorhabdus sp. SCSIO 66989]WOE74344.1 hypothetical protein RB602_10860 [Parasphingorhabdus sp. SCSIO 66989]
MRFAILIAAIAAATGFPAYAEPESVEAFGFVTAHEVEVSTDPDETFAMLRTPDKWWSAEHSWTGDASNFYMGSQASGCFCEQIPADEPDGLRGSVEHMRIVFIQPGKMLRMTGALGPLQSEAVDGTLTVTLAPTDAGTKVKFEYVVGGYMRLPQDVIAGAVDSVIGEQASRFSMALGPVVDAPESDGEEEAASPEDETSDDADDEDEAPASDDSE